MKQESKEAIFLALTKMHRDISNGENNIKFHPLFHSFNVHNPNLVTDIKKAMIKMNIIKIRKDGTVEWNSEKCLPNPNLVEGILFTIKEMRKEQKSVKVKIKVVPTETEHFVVVINGILYQADRTTIAW